MFPEQFAITLLDDAKSSLFRGLLAAQLANGRRSFDNSIAGQSHASATVKRRFCRRGPKGLPGYLGIWGVEKAISVGLEGFLDTEARVFCGAGQLTCLRSTGPESKQGCSKAIQKVGG